MNVLLLGATGFSGKEVLTELLSKNHKVTIITRDKSSIDFKEESLTVLEGNVLDENLISKAVKNQDAVINCLGIGGKGNSKPNSLVSDATKILVNAMERSKVKRLLCMSNVGAGDSMSFQPWIFSKVLLPYFMKWLKVTKLIILIILFSNTLFAQVKNKDKMEKETINTTIGNIVLYQKIVPNTIPVVFLHGVYYDHNLWNYYTSRITDRTVISVDMPHHGLSKDISKKNWNMDDCANMLIEIIDHLQHKEIYAIGHSWGSMTILRASNKDPEKFKAIGLCNMPFDKGTLGKQLKFGFQHLLLPFRRFYVKQVAKVMFSTQNKRAKPEIAEYLEVSMSLLSNREVRKTDKAVLTKVDDGNQYLDSLKVPAFALRGNIDYVGTPKNIEMMIVDGAHTSPLEQAEEVFTFIKKVIEN